MSNKQNKRSRDYSRKEKTRAERVTPQRLLRVLFTKMDQDQSDCFWEWIKEIKGQQTLYDNMNARLKHVTSKSINELVQEKILCDYGERPSKCGMKKPDFITNNEDKSWARINIEGSAKLIGILDKQNSEFKVVFLDKDHRFWEQKK